MRAWIPSPYFKGFTWYQHKGVSDLHFLKKYISQHNSPIQGAFKSYLKGLFSSSSQEGPTSSSKKRINIATAISHQNKAEQIGFDSCCGHFFLSCRKLLESYVSVSDGKPTPRLISWTKRCTTSSNICVTHANSTDIHLNPKSRSTSKER